MGKKPPYMVERNTPVLILSEGDSNLMNYYPFGQINSYILFPAEFLGQFPVDNKTALLHLTSFSDMNCKKARAGRELATT